MIDRTSKYYTNIYIFIHYKYYRLLTGRVFSGVLYYFQHGETMRLLTITMVPILLICYKGHFGHMVSNKGYHNNC